MSDANVRSFYRFAKRVPPADKEYLTDQERRGDPPEHLPQHIKDSWDGLSAFDSIENLRAAVRNAMRSVGGFIVRYDVPEVSGISITYSPKVAIGHYDLRGDKEELKTYLTDFVVDL